MEREKLRIKRIGFIQGKELDQVLKVISKSSRSEREDLENFLREKKVLSEEERIIDFIVTGGYKGRIYIGE